MVRVSSEQIWTKHCTSTNYQPSKAWETLDIAIDIHSLYKLCSCLGGPVHSVAKWELMEPVNVCMCVWGGRSCPLSTFPPGWWGHICGTLPALAPCQASMPSFFPSSIFPSSVFTRPSQFACSLCHPPLACISLCMSPNGVCMGLKKFDQKLQSRLIHTPNKRFSKQGLLTTTCCDQCSKYFHECCCH